MSSTRGVNDPKRDARDWYRTPFWCVQELYKALPALPWPTLDPCAGDGALLRCWSFGVPIRGIELDPDLVEVGKGTHGLSQGDGLACSWEGEHILMNPPYRDALTWVRKGVEEAESTTALLRLGFLGSQARRLFWLEHPPRALVILSKRPSFTGKGTDSADYGWFIWTKDEKLATRSGLVSLAWITKPSAPGH